MEMDRRGREIGRGGENRERGRLHAARQLWGRVWQRRGPPSPHHKFLQWAPPRCTGSRAAAGSHHLEPRAKVHVFGSRGSCEAARSHQQEPNATACRGHVGQHWPDYGTRKSSALVPEDKPPPCLTTCFRKGAFASCNEEQPMWVTALPKPRKKNRRREGGARVEPGEGRGGGGGCAGRSRACKVPPNLGIGFKQQGLVQKTVAEKV